jgi:hypothetical protein
MDSAVFISSTEPSPASRRRRDLHRISATDDMLLLDIQSTPCVSTEGTEPSECASRCGAAHRAFDSLQPYSPSRKPPPPNKSGIGLKPLLYLGRVTGLPLCGGPKRGGHFIIAADRFPSRHFSQKLRGWRDSSHNLNIFPRFPCLRDRRPRHRQRHAASQTGVGTPSASERRPCQRP